VAFVMGALSFVTVALLSRLVLGEKISGVRGIGLLLILAGVAVMGDQA
jgi:drug/metabolite transporter (DMT)-like permease